MKNIRTYQNINDALLEQSWLESNGIESFIPDEISASSALPHLSVYSGIRLQVNESDFEAALKLLPKQPTSDPTEEKNENKRCEFPETITLGWFKALIAADLTLYILSIILGFSHLSRIPDSILRYASDQYISYPFATLAYYSFWPFTILGIISSVGLFFLKGWARFLYIALWAAGMLYLLFSSAYFIYPSGAFLGGLSTLLGGFICCMIYFTNASSFFTKKGANNKGSCRLSPTIKVLVD